MLLCDILFHIFVLLNILSCGIIVFFKKDIFQTLIHLSFDEGLLQSKSWTNRDGFACIKW